MSEAPVRAPAPDAAGEDPLAAALQKAAHDIERVARVQAAMFPRERTIPGLEVAAATLPFEPVTGDYFDVQPAPNGCWIGIGDVAGHGVAAGVLMIMLQSIVAATARSRPGATPAEVLNVVNEVMFETIRNRLGEDDHVTLTVLRFHVNGRFEYAGAHEEIIVCRARGGACDVYGTPGVWTGIVEKTDHLTVTTTFDVEHGDLIVLYTDGIIEATDEAGELFGVERLCDELERRRTAPVHEIRNEILGAVRDFQAAPRDDATLVVLRYQAPGREA
jgi:sigma-B regulation protein RsbU (phosphoserine phosphatase)